MSLQPLEYVQSDDGSEATLVFFSFAKFSLLSTSKLRTVEEEVTRRGRDIVYIEVKRTCTSEVFISDFSSCPKKFIFTRKKQRLVYEILPLGVPWAILNIPIF